MGFRTDALKHSGRTSCQSSSHARVRGVHCPVRGGGTAMVETVAEPIPSDSARCAKNMRPDHQPCQCRKFRLSASMTPQCTCRSRIEDRSNSNDSCRRFRDDFYALPRTIANSAIRTYIPYSICRKKAARGSASTSGWISPTLGNGCIKTMSRLANRMVAVSTT